MWNRSERAAEDAEEEVVRRGVQFIDHLAADDVDTVSIVDDFRAGADAGVVEDRSDACNASAGGFSGSLRQTAPPLTAHARSGPKSHKRLGAT